MRWIVASLLVLNIAVLAGQLLIPADAPPRSKPAANAVNLDQAPRIELLSELEEATLRAMMEQKTRASLQSKGPADEPLCTLVGPFARLLHAEYMVERLQALDAQARIQEVEVPGETAYWVYLPAQDSTRAGLNRLRELQAKGIDSYLIPSGELGGGISLGMFSRDELARQRQANMRDQGYPAELSEITRSYKETYVVLPPGEAGKIGTDAWQRMLAEAEEDGLERRQNFCPAVASQDNIQ